VIKWDSCRWIQNVTKPRRNSRIGKVLDSGEPRFHATIAAIWNAIAVLERFCRAATETEIATETAFWILGPTCNALYRPGKGPQWHTQLPQMGQILSLFRPHLTHPTSVCFWSEDWKMLVNSIFFINNEYNCFFPSLNEYQRCLQCQVTTNK